MSEIRKPYDYVVFIGRFQPFHNGHLEVVKKAFEIADKIIILVGSSGKAFNIKNPFGFDMRRAMILGSCSDCYLDTNRMKVVPLRDFPYNDNAWVNEVQTQVSSCLPWADKPLKGAIIGHSKDESSYYLKLFPQWRVVEHSIDEIVNATDIRGIYFSQQNPNYMVGVVPTCTMDFLLDFKKRAEFKNLVEEYDFVQRYRKEWAAAPYPPTFVTTDAVVIQSGHVLLVERGVNPGKGLLALPGGFLEQKELIVDGIIRELREETGLKVPVPVLKGSIKKMQVFDHPDRSLRGRTITHAALIDLGGGELSHIKGGDDARRADWVLFDHVRESLMFEDHFSILYELGGFLK